MHVKPRLPINDVTVVQVLEAQQHTSRHKHRTELVKRPLGKQHVQSAQPHAGQHLCACVCIIVCVGCIM